MYATGNSGM
jgi:hypothetical protein